MNNNHGNKFFDGFLWGAILGGGLVFLLGTKKGKKLLKTITEEGVEGLSEILEAQMDEEDLEEDGEEMEDKPSFAKASKGKEDEPEKVSGNGLSEEKTINESKPSIRKRFFRKKPA